MLKRAGRIGLIFTLVSSSAIGVIAQASAAYAFSSHTFTTCGQTGQNGPAQSSCRSAYSTTWDDSDTNFTVVNGIQFWTVPYTGLYRISASGAAGSGGSGSYGTSSGGSGAQVQGDFNLTEGNKIRILVGQPGITTNITSGDGASGSGGGGTFVISGTTGTDDSQVLLIAAGGGGGNDPGYQSFVTNGLGGLHTSSGTGTAENSGGSYRGTGTGGANLNGGSFANGGIGGSYSRSDLGTGGFGGGGATDDAPTGGGGWVGGTGSVAAYSKNNGANQSGVSATNSGAGSVTITSLGPSITSFSPSVSLTNSSTLTFNLVFSQSVTGINSVDFTASGTGASTCSIGTVTGSGTTYSIPVTSCSQGTVFLTALANIGTNTSSQTGPAANTNSTSVTVDLTSPTISSVTTTNGTYTPSSNANLNFTTTFSESVTVTGQPQIPITIGSTSRNATFVALTDSRTATFRYTVTANSSDVDTDGIQVSTTLNLNSGSISDLAGNSLTPLTFTAPVTTGVFVAQTPAAPTIDSITATNGQLAIAFTAGASNGSAITNYEFSTNNGVNWTTRSPVATTSPLTITGLTNGQSYSVRLRAINGAGSGESSTAVSATPTAVAVTGDSTLTLTYGSSASTSAYSATGGTNTYTWSLGSALTGITLSGTTVTASSSTPAGTYSQTVRATDGNSQVGTKSLTITVNKASTSITISLPNSATDAALGGAVTITATVPRAGAVNFRLGGSTISGCGSASAATTTATCSWTPASLGSVTLTAIFTPTDTSNFETSTSTTLSITVVNGVSTVTLSLAGGAITAPKGQAINIIAAVDQDGRITFFVDGKKVPRCINRAASVGNVTCSWKPAVQKAVTISARLTPTNNVYNASSSSMSVQVVRRSGAR
jgi:hypothetical protein